MNHFEVLKFHIIRLMKSSSILGSLLLLPAAMILFFAFTNTNQPSTTSEIPQEVAIQPDEQVATVIFLEEDNDIMRQGLIKKDWGTHIWINRELATKRLNEGKVGAIYTIPSNFINRTDKTLKVEVRNPNHQSTALEYDIRQIVREYALQQALIGIDASIESVASVKGLNIQIEDSQSTAADIFKSMPLILLLIFYILVGGSSIGVDLISLKKNHILRRSVVSPNESWRTLGILLISYSIFMFLVNVVLLTLIQYFYAIEATLYWRSIGLILLSILFSLSSAIAMFRVFKHPAYASSIGTLIYVLLLGLAFADNIFDSVFIQTFTYLSPFKWIIHIFDTGEWLMSTIIVLLMSGVLFTAGSYRLENYARS